MQPNDNIQLLRIAAILAALGLLVFIAIRVVRGVLRQDSEQGTAKCKKDAEYYFKDPAQHPYDC